MTFGQKKMNKMIKKVVITDLDNTLFDWFNTWYESFSAMLDETSKISGISKAELIEEIRPIHQKYGTAEYAFVLEEIPKLQSMYKSKEEIRKAMSPAINAFRNARQKNLVLYPTVIDTLLELRKKGVLIVGYTESKSYYSSYRITKLGLDGILDYLYSPEDHSIPDNRLHTSTYELKETIHLHTPNGEIKPNPEILKQIISDIGAEIDECVYVGDSEMKDIDMAKSAKVTDVFAEYGNSHFGNDEVKYDLLRAVTHWTNEDVLREKEIKEQYHKTKPTFTIRKFSDILSFFEYSKFKSNKPPKEKGAPIEKLKLEVDIWKTTIDVQKHFNDMSMRIKNYAILMLTAFIGAIGIIIKNGVKFSVLDHSINLSSAVGLFAIIIWNLIFFMDYYWYHPMLKGSVKSALNIEERLRFDLPTLNLTHTIGHYSHKDNFLGKPFDSSRKAKYFYNCVTITLSLLTIFLFFSS